MSQLEDVALGDLSPTAPSSCEEMAARFGSLGISLPVEADLSSPGFLVDAHGVEFAVVDHDRARSDFDTHRLAQAISTAINLAANC